jgi:hypothetical protein
VLTYIAGSSEFFLDSFCTQYSIKYWLVSGIDNACCYECSLAPSAVVAAEEKQALF